MTASYAIPVRRAETLPAASFRFRLATDTLAVRLSVPTIRVRRGLAPPSHQAATMADWMALARHAPCLAHIQKEPAALFVAGSFLFRNRLIYAGSEQTHSSKPVLQGGPENANPVDHASAEVDR